MNEVVHTSPTIGSNVEEVVWKNIHFLMWDIGGQESLRASWNTYYTNTQVNCLLYQPYFLVLRCFLYPGRQFEGGGLQRGLCHFVSLAEWLFGWLPAVGWCDNIFGVNCFCSL